MRLHLSGSKAPGSRRPATEAVRPDRNLATGTDDLPQKQADSIVTGTHERSRGASISEKSGVVNESLQLACPYHLAQGYLDETFRDQGQDGRSHVLQLEVPVGGQHLVKNVLVEVSLGRDPMHMDHPWRVHWRPQGGGPYPAFDGELTVRAGEDYDRAVLEMTGSYRPPGGALGAAFDLIAGHELASATMRVLLGKIARDFEAHYQGDEAAKRSKRAAEQTAE